MFRRTKDQLPRGNGTLMLRIGFNDYRDRIYRSIGKLVDTPRGALLFMQEYLDRTEGTPAKRIEKTVRRESKFVFTTRDGVETPRCRRPRRWAAGPRRRRRVTRTRSSSGSSRCGCKENEGGHPVEGLSNLAGEERYGLQLDPADIPNPSDEAIARVRENRRRQRAAEIEAA